MTGRRLKVGWSGDVYYAQEITHRVNLNAILSLFSIKCPSMSLVSLFIFVFPQQLFLSLAFGIF